MVVGKLLYTKELFLLILIDGKYGFINEFKIDVLNIPNKDIVINTIFEVVSNLSDWLLELE